MAGTHPIEGPFVGREQDQAMRGRTLSEAWCLGSLLSMQELLGVGANFCSLGTKKMPQLLPERSV